MPTSSPLITWTPDPIAFQLGPIPVYWYGDRLRRRASRSPTVVITREARRPGHRRDARRQRDHHRRVAALIGGRLYHVIDQWDLYKDDPLKIILPPYTGLGVYGGIMTGTIAGVVVTRLLERSRS